VQRAWLNLLGALPFSSESCTNFRSTLSQARLAGRARARRCTARLCAVNGPEIGTVRNFLTVHPTGPGLAGEER
jgi:hypothetical protein